MKKETLINLKRSLYHKISPNMQKIIGAASIIPFIAASTMQGSCAGGCPYGLVNDPFPGNCSRYIDLNGDGICDLSQVLTTSITTDTSNTSSIDTSTVDSRGNGAHSAQNIETDPSNATIIQDPGNGVQNPPIDAHNYNIIPISVLVIGGYLFTHYLFKKGILKPSQHRRLWNLLLVVGYLGTGLTGIILTLMINLGISTFYNNGITYWHAEMSILMVVGTLIHLHLYKKPFKNMFKVLFGINISSKKNTNIKSVAKLLMNSLIK